MYSYLFKENELYKKLTIKELVDILIKADKNYHLKGINIIKDEEYDLLRKILKEKSPNNSYLKKIGYKPVEKNKVKLPYYLGSQNKYYYEDAKDLNKWFSKFNNPEEYYISEKLDGISCLITSSINKEIKIYTRGDGINGTDITYIKDYIKTIPIVLPANFAVRGELLLSKENWDKVKNQGANARNLVAGIINSKKINKELLSLIDFVAYDYISNRISISEGMNFLKSISFKIAKNELIYHKINVDYLLEKLKEFKNNSEYEIDGIIITHNTINLLDNNKNPEYSFAFKANSLLDIAEVIVENIEWNVSKDRYIKPVVIFKGVLLEGVKIQRASGFNADFIVKNKIGKGSIIKIQRSGGVIPDIVEVIKESDNGEPLMPKIPYIWNKSKIDIIIEGNEKNREQDIKTFSYFMKSLKIKGIGDGIITKLYDNSYNTILKIINISKTEILNIEGFKEKSANNLIEALKEIRNKSCKELMNASNLLGRGVGEKKLELIFNKYPFICKDKNKALELTIEELKEINGMGDIISKQFKDNLKKFFDFYEDLGIENNEENNQENNEENNQENNEENNKENKFFNGKYFVFSGFRNKEYEDIIKINNGIINDNIVKNTNYLIIKNFSKISEKIKKAKDKGIIILTEEEFKKILYK